VGDGTFLTPKGEAADAIPPNGDGFVEPALSEGCGASVLGLTPNGFENGDGFCSPNNGAGEEDVDGKEAVVSCNDDALVAPAAWPFAVGDLVAL
jgi:hypothetical protein